MFIEDADRFRFRPAVVDTLRQQPTPFGFNGLGETTFFTRYSRVQEDGTQELWGDVLARKIEGMQTIFRAAARKNNLSRSVFDSLLTDEMLLSMLFSSSALRWSGPGRSFWCQGTDYVYERGSAALNNCFVGSTSFFTKEHGLIALQDAVGQEVHVLTQWGWKAASVKSFGVQPVQRIRFAPGDGVRRFRTSVRRSIEATPNHRWLLKDGTETTELRVGDVVVTALRDKNIQDPDFQEGFRHGLVFADGSRSGYQAERNKGTKFQIRLCGDKAQHAHLFSHTTMPASYNGDVVGYVVSETNYKALPENRSPDYVAGFIDGWCAGDGSTTRTGSLEVSMQDEQAWLWLHEHAPLAGYIVTGASVQKSMHTNLGVRREALRKIKLRRDTEVYWHVEAIEALRQEQEVFCAVVPEVGSFTLEGGIYTGNCAYTAVTDLARDAGWCMDMLMCGIGVGFDTRFLQGNLKLFQPHSVHTNTRFLFVVPDTREGWAESLEELIRSYLRPNMPSVVFDYSKVRPAGSLIRGFGGIASGPEPLRKLHERVRGYLERAFEEQRTGQINTTRLIADIFNAIGACVVAGNVRRSAEIALGSGRDEIFINLKNYEMHPDRAEIGWMSNNTVVLEDEGDYRYLPQIAERIIDNGEPGIANMMLISDHARLGHLKTDNAMGLNPCGEIPLNTHELCCLSEVYLPRIQDVGGFVRAATHAAIYAFAVSLLPTHREETNAVLEENHRIGVSVTGVADFVDRNGQKTLERWLSRGYQQVKEVTDYLADTFNVNRPIRLTTVKPSGTVSLLAGVSPGMHWPTFQYAVRRIRQAANSPLVPVLQEAGVPWEEDTYSDNTLVFEFPISHGNTRPATAVSLWEQAEMLVNMQSWWADNAVSCTLYFDPEKEANDVLPVLQYIAPRVKSASFLPHTEDGVYAQAPYSGISQKEYTERERQIKNIDWKKFVAQGSSDGQDSRFCENDNCEWTPTA